MGHIFWSLDLILHFCGQMPFGTIIQNNFTISHSFGMNPLHMRRNKKQLILKFLTEKIMLEP